MPTRAKPAMRATLDNGEFRALWFAESQSNLGDQLTKVVLSVLVYNRTGSAFWAAAAYALTFLPALAGGLGLAQLADRHPRRTVLTTCTAMQAATVGLMAIPATPLPVLCGLFVIVQLAGAPANAAQNAITREVFTDDELYLRSQDLRGITTNCLMLVGLAGGGLLASAVASSWVLAIDAMTFAVSAVVVRRWVRHRPAAGDTRDGWFSSAGWVFAQPPLRVLLAFSWLVGLAVVPGGLAPPLAREMGESTSAVGWLLAADVAGYVIGVFLLSHYLSLPVRQRLLGALATGSVAVLIGFAAKPDFGWAIGLLVLAGALGGYLITVTATVTTMVPNHLRGGAIGLYRTGLRVSQGLSVAIGGALAQVLGSAMDAIALLGAAGVLLTIPTAIAWAKHRPRHL